MSCTTSSSAFPRTPARFAWDRIDLKATLETWGRNIDYTRVFPLLALDGHKIVGDASLHRRESGPLRLSGRIKWLIDPEYREVGVGSVLVNRLIDTARRAGLRHVTCLLVSDLEADAVDKLTDLGFESYEIPDFGADPDGGTHNMTNLVYRL